MNEHSPIFEKAKEYYNTIFSDGTRKWSAQKIIALGEKGLLTQEEVVEIIGEDE